MSRRISTIATLLVLSLVVACGGKDEKPDLTVKAHEFIDLLVHHEFFTATAQFDSTMLEELPAERLKEVWQTLTNQAGPFEEILNSRVETSPFYTRVITNCRFERTMIDIKVVFDKTFKIAGLFFTPGQPDVSSSYQAPEYVHSETITEKNAVIGSGEWTLPATLTLPLEGGPFPAVVLVHGSGPQDRDETIGPNMPFRDLAWGLATRGIAVLRYDKRTLHYNDRFASGHSGITLDEEVTDDALEAVKFLRGVDSIDDKKIFVLGHSLGGEMIPRIASRDPELAGFIIMAGSTRPLEDLIVEQFTYIYSLDGAVSDSEQVELDILKERVAKVKDPDLSPDTPTDQLPLRVPAAYWLELRDYDATGTAAKLSQPMLILQGARDYQVTEADFDGWKKALSGRKNVEFKLYPKLNHLFMEGEDPSSPNEYALPGHVSAKLIEDITAWVKQQ